jgi:hypothetical protein
LYARGLRAKPGDVPATGEDVRIRPPLWSAAVIGIAVTDG